LGKPKDKLRLQVGGISLIRTEQNRGRGSYRKGGKKHPYKGKDTAAQEKDCIIKKKGREKKETC